MKLRNVRTMNASLTRVTEIPNASASAIETPPIWRPGRLRYASGARAPSSRLRQCGHSVAAALTGSAQ